jgi:hypothetical protein
LGNSKTLNLIRGEGRASVFSGLDVKVRVSAECAYGDW